jgi:hypothetical protein
MSSLKSIVRIYIAKIRPRAQTELDWFKQQPTLKSAINLAALATNSNSKRYSHQRRLKKETLERARIILSANLENIEKCGSFDELFTLIEIALQSVGGIGELFVYDTALRIGAKLNLFPDEVYLHTGTRVGAKALGFDGKATAIEITALPIELRQLEPHEIEDVLCIFKSELSKETVKASDEGISKRSWCG